jgi:hypothetical protein
MNFTLALILATFLGQESITVAVTPPTQKYTVVLKAAKPPAGAFTVWNIYPRAGIETVSRSTTEWKLLAPPGGTFEAVRSVATADGNQTDDVVAFKTSGEPAPPFPPNPIPPTPEPDTLVLTAAVKAAYATETDAGKAAKCVSLADMYELSTRAGGIVANKSYATDADILRAMQESRRASPLTDTDIPKVRRALADWFNGRLPRETVPADDALRAKFSKEFWRASVALREAVK